MVRVLSALINGAIFTKFGRAPATSNNLILDDDTAVLGLGAVGLGNLLYLINYLMKSISGHEIG